MQDEQLLESNVFHSPSNYSSCDRLLHSVSRKTHVIVWTCLAMWLTLLLTGVLVVVFTRPARNPCDNLPVEPCVCFFEHTKPTDKSWRVKHNVGYYNIRPPHVEVANPSSHRAGEIYYLSHLRVDGKSIQWTVENCIGMNGTAHFTVYYDNSMECYVKYPRGNAWPRRGC
jgi:hypothetical protein